ncbi:MAG: hypothetical protein AAFV72_00390 [Cyanobacteria bacterium J06635_1]
MPIKKKRRKKPKRDNTEKKLAAKLAYVSSKDLSFSQLAEQFGVSTVTVQRWSSADPDGPWTAQRRKREDLQVANVLPFAVPAGKAHTPEELTRVAPKATREAKAAREAGDIDPLQIVDLAIADLSSAMQTQAQFNLPQGMGACAGGLVRLLEFRRKLQPPTAAELAEQVIALGISPQEFTAELSRQWAKTA